MKKIVLTFLSLILMLGVGLGLSNVKSEQKTKAESVSFSMEEGAAFRSYWSIGNCGIRFSGEISDASKEVYLFVAPYDYVTKIRGNNTGAIDYITAFKNAGRTYQSIIPQKVVEGGVVHLYAGLKNIKANNLSRKFFGVFYYYENGVYHYAEMPKGEVGQARSMAYLSSAYSKDATSENDIKMTSYFVENAVKAAISMKDKSVNVEEIKYNKEERNVEISRVELSGTSLDDYLPQEKVVLRLNSGKEIEVNNALDLRINYNDSEIASYINQAGKKGEMINITQATPNNGIEYTGEIGLGEASFKLKITPYDISKASITSQDIRFTDRLNAEGSKLYDTYNTTDITPRVTVTVPKGGRILSDKVFTNSNMSELGTLAFSYNTNGANLQDVGDASVEIKPTITATISGSKLSGNIVKNSIATKNKFTVSVDNSNGANVASAYQNTLPQDKVYTHYYKQTYDYTLESMYGHSAYENSNKVTNVTGTVGAANITKNITYNPNSYTMQVTYSTEDSQEVPATKTTSVLFGHSGTINSPEITGYGPDKMSVEKVMTTEGNTENVYYALNTYLLTVNYDYASNYENKNSSTQAKHTSYVKYKQAYSVATPADTGYDVSASEISGNMPAEAVTETVTYSPKQYDCYINYVYSNNNNYEGKGGTTYSTYKGPNGNNKVYYMQTIPTQTSPVLTGYTADTKSYAETNATGAFTKTVTYNTNTYNVTINYQYYDKYDTVDGSPYDNGASYIATLYYQQSFNYVQNAKSGYLTYFNNDRTNQVASNATAKVTGNYTDVIYYMPDTYTATVNYTGITHAASTLNVKCGYPFKINTPTVSGQIASSESISGTMGASNYTTSVSYSAYSAASEQSVHFDGFQTTDAYFGEIGDISSFNTTNGNTYTAAGGATWYNQTNYNWNRFMLVENGEFLTAQEFYFELEFKLTDIYHVDEKNTEPASKIGFRVETSATNSHFIFIDAGSGANNAEEGKRQGIGVFYQSNGNWFNHSTTAVYMPNYRNNWIKLAIWKSGNAITLSVENTQVLTYTSDEINGNCRYGFSAFRATYQVKNARWRKGGGPTGETFQNGVHLSNTVNHTDFYFQTELRPNTNANNAGDGLYPKVGIEVFSKADNRDRLFFFMDLQHGGEYELGTTNKRVALATCIDETYHWLDGINTINYDAYAGSERYAIVDANAPKFIDNFNTFSVLKRGRTITFMLNGVPYLQSTNDLFAGECGVGVKADSFNTTFQNSWMMYNTTKLDNVQKERGINTDGITIDGSISDSEWANAGINRVEKTASNGESYSFRAFAGRTYVYVAGTIKTKFFNHDQEYYWHNSNIEVRAFDGNTENYNQCAFSGKKHFAGQVANYGFTYSKSGDMYTLNYELAIDYSAFNTTKGDNSLIVMFGFRPGHNGSADYTNNELGGLWWSDAIKYEITGSGIQK